MVKAPDATGGGGTSTGGGVGSGSGSGAGSGAGSGSGVGSGAGSGAGSGSGVGSGSGSGAGSGSVGGLGWDVSGGGGTDSGGRRGSPAGGLGEPVSGAGSPGSPVGFCGSAPTRTGAGCGDPCAGKSGGAGVDGAGRCGDLTATEEESATSRWCRPGLLGPMPAEVRQTCGLRCSPTRSARQSPMQSRRCRVGISAATRWATYAVEGNCPAVVRSTPKVMPTSSATRATARSDGLILHIDYRC